MSNTYGIYRSAVILLGCSLAATATPPKACNLTVRTLKEAPVRGRLLELSLPGELRLETDAATALVIRCDELVWVARDPDRACPPRPRRCTVEVHLAGGDRLYGNPILRENEATPPQAEDTVRLETTELGTLDLPLRLVERWINPPSADPDAEGAARMPRDPAIHMRPAAIHSEEDVLRLSNGDVVSGLLLAIDARRVTFESDDGELVLPHAQVLDIALAGDRPSSAPGLRARVQLGDGSRLTVSEMRGDQEALTLRLFGETNRTVRWDQVDRIDLAGGRWTWITELEPIGDQHSAMLGLDWPVARNINVLGGPLSIADRRFVHGLGVHSESILIYDLAEGYEWFVTSFGVDDSAGRLADVTAEIRVDGQVRHRREHVVAGELWGPVRIDIRGAARIELHALFGANASIQDRFNWADAGLIRPATPGGKIAPGKVTVE